MLNVDDKVLKDIGRGFSVPAQPSLLIKLQNLMAKGDPNMNLIAETITQDVSISSIILKTINSPLYGLARSISDIKKAVRYIGINGINALVTSSLIRNSFAQDSCSIALDDFWINSTNIANSAVYISKRFKQGVAADKMFTIGLFHDCGIPVMAMKFNDYQSALERAIKSPTETLPEIEETAYQVNHATIGYYVASSWRLPKDICQLILSHHDRDFLKVIDGSAQQHCYAILKMAENIVWLHKHFCNSADWHYIADSIFTVLDIDEDDMKDIIEDLSDELI